MSNRKFLGIWAPVLAFFTVLAIAATTLLSVYGDAVSSQLGYGTYTVTNAADTEDWDTEYNTADYASVEDVVDASEDLVRAIAGEGFVLAKNDNGALPLASPSNVTMLGRTAADPVYGGSGSGSVDTSTAVTAREGLEDAGLTVNDTVFAELADFAAANERFVIVPAWELDNPQTTNYRIGEMPADQYSDAAIASFAEYGDAALVFVGRGGGEAGDLTRDMSEWDDNYVEGQHQLELNKDEMDALELAKANFDTVILVANVSTSMELGDVQADPGIDAIIIAGAAGATGFDALGLIVTGEINPSGRTVDTWSADFTQDPTWNNWGYFAYSNITDDVSPTGDGFFVQYEEGIYTGYRYYETAAVEGFIDYDEAVVYPFGYGLSYTEFAWEVTGQDLGGVDGDIAVDVTVTNTGDVAGKDVVEAYFSAPYTSGGIEKAEVVLADFAKTSLLEPGASETVTLTFAVEDMASYDYKDAAAYVLEQGDYEVRIQTDSHLMGEGVEPIVYTVDDTVVYDEGNARVSDEAVATNVLDDVSGYFVDASAEEGQILNLSRADFAGTFPTRPTGSDYVADDDTVAAFQAYDAEAAATASDAEMPLTGASNGLQLIDLRGVEYDDPVWDLLLDQLTVEEMTAFTLHGAYQTAALESVGLPGGLHADGPAGFGNFVASALSAGVAYPSAVVIAGTWNKDLALDMGSMIGNEALLRGVAGWYAPAVNMHRSPFSGRNFEYYSEDPILSGLIATEVVTGALAKGLPAFVKHYAINDQETNRSRNGLATWVNEQAAREIYLKPFEMVIKDSSAEISYIADDEGTVATAEVGALAVMSSFNRVGATWAGGSEALMDTVLRDEWGFDGVVISDFNTNDYQYPDEGISAGTDLTMAYENLKSYTDTESAEAVTNLRKATKNILFAVANSSLMDGIASGADVTYNPPAWRYWQAAITALVGVTILGGIALVGRRVRRHRVAATTASAAV